MNDPCCGRVDREPRGPIDENIRPQHLRRNRGYGLDDPAGEEARREARSEERRY
jgi:hypothetical protein